MLDKKYLEFVSLTSGVEGVFVKCFQDTSLRPTSYIKVRTLEEMLKFGFVNRVPVMFYWHEKVEDGVTNEYFKQRDAEEWVSLKNLIQDCTEVREYCKEYYSEYLL